MFKDIACIVITPRFIQHIQDLIECCVAGAWVCSEGEYTGTMTGGDSALI